MTLTNDIKEILKPTIELSYTERINLLLSSLSRGFMPPTAYDTAWVARLLEIDRPLGGRAAEWLCEHQLPDGSWGAQQPFYYQDRIISTLSAMTALCRFGKRAEDRRRLQAGQAALDKLVGEANARIHAEPQFDSIGFELIVPTLIQEAESLGLIQNHKQVILANLAAHREDKLRRLAGRRIDRTFSTAFSAEMASTDYASILDADHLPEPNGSVGCSPAATAYYALTIRPGESRALAYLHEYADHGGIPHVAPFDTFERLWVLWNIAIAYSPHDLPEGWYTPHLTQLERTWREKSGLGFGSEYSITDPDGTSVGADVYYRYGRSARISDLLGYQTDTFFMTYKYESGLSTSINIHALGALRQAGYSFDHPVVQGILDFLTQEWVDESYWVDKWHYSPYYPTAHYIINAAGWLNRFVNATAEWLIRSQKPDGSWGWQISNAEETAYALQALCTWRQAGGLVEDEVLLQGVAWLRQHAEPPYPPQWIGKCLYCPELVVKSAILSAEILVNRTVS